MLLKLLSLLPTLRPGPSTPYSHIISSTLSLLLYPEAGGSEFLQNGGHYLPDDMAYFMFRISQIQILVQRQALATDFPKYA
jgi:hypothetical protein